MRGLIGQIAVDVESGLEIKASARPAEVFEAVVGKRFGDVVSSSLTDRMIRLAVGLVPLFVLGEAGLIFRLG